MYKFKKYLSYFILVGLLCACIGKISFADEFHLEDFEPEYSSGGISPCENEQITVANYYISPPNTSETVRACVWKGNGFEFADNSGKYVRFAGQGVFYRINQSSFTIAGRNPDVALYLITQGSQPVTKYTTHFSQTLIPQYDTDGISISYYDVDLSKFEDMADQTGKPVMPEGPQMSDDGRYIAYFSNYELWLYDTNDKTTRRIADVSDYNLGFYGSPIIGAVSNNGRFIYLNRWERLYDTQDCNRQGGTCHYASNIMLKSHRDRTNFAYFDEEQEKLLLMTDNTNGIAHYEVSLEGLMGTQELAGLQYLALGDSYSSGEGDQSKDKNGATFYREHTDDDGTLMVDGSTNKIRPREKCHLSTNSYPYHLALGMELGEPTTSIDTTKWQSVACSGATAWDVKEQGTNDYEGQGDGDKPRLEGYNVEELKTQALNEFIPGRQKQIEFVKKYQPKVITLTMGGNDVDFGGKMQECIVSTLTCTYAKAESRSKMKNELSDQYENLNNLYKELVTATGGKTKIYVLGYPMYINADPHITKCSNILNLDVDERVFIANSIIYLNNIIETAAKNAGVTYVNTENAFGNHRVCDNGENHANAITGFLGYQSNEAQESFHPNKMGHVDLANVVWDFTNGQSLIDYATCANGKATCPDTTITYRSAKVPPYFNSNDDKDDDTVVRYYTLTNGTLVKSVSHYDVKTRHGWFEPDSKVDITLYSIPTHIGQFSVDGLGNLNTTISIPPQIPAGFHRLVVRGMSMDGRPLEVYQTLLINGEDAGDLDEDGISDSVDMCAYGIPINVSVDMNTDQGCQKAASVSPGNNLNSELRNTAEIIERPASLHITKYTASFDQNVKSEVSGDAVTDFDSDNESLIKTHREDESSSIAMSDGFSFFSSLIVVSCVLLLLLVLIRFVSLKR